MQVSAKRIIQKQYGSYLVRIFYESGGLHSGWTWIVKKVRAKGWLKRGFCWAVSPEDAEKHFRQSFLNEN